MAPGQNKPQQNGQKKKGYNPYNKFKNRNWKKKKPNNDNSSKPNNGDSNQNQSHAILSSPVKIVQTPISNKILKENFVNMKSVLFSYIY